MAEHNEFGKKGEKLAADFLSRKGHEVVCMNYRVGRDEIDVISKVNNLLVFTEVKARSNYAGGFPELAVSKQKQKRMARVAQHYIEQNQYAGEIRYDIVAIVKGFPIHHIEDAFFPVS
jgi:putative endonuclease